MSSNISVVNGNEGIIEVFRSIDRGNFIIDVEEAVKVIVERVLSTQNKGAVQIKLGFEYDNQTEAMRISAEIKETMPKEPKKASLFFVTPEGNLSRHNPRQPDMFPAQPSTRGVTND